MSGNRKVSPLAGANRSRNSTDATIEMPILGSVEHRHVPHLGAQARNVQCANQVGFVSALDITGCGPSPRCNDASNTGDSESDC